MIRRLIRARNADTFALFLMRHVNSWSTNRVSVRASPVPDVMQQRERLWELAKLGFAQLR
ncbi:MAG: hypothetical protein JWQ50_4860 [Caballeronia mineralivorans]|jgi:hypothetical protein|nr:hypothetical protein [Caballeronia mineralivorans]MEA3104930.1 hypothetical protein [Caballeronia mineralivorans]